MYLWQLKTCLHLYMLVVSTCFENSPDINLTLNRLKLELICSGIRAYMSQSLSMRSYFMVDVIMAIYSYLVMLHVCTMVNQHCACARTSLEICRRKLYTGLSKTVFSLDFTSSVVYYVLYTT